MKKGFIFALVISLVLTAFVGCSSNDNNANNANNSNEVSTDVDVTTTASIVNNSEAFAKGLSKDGTWIVATLNDLSFDKELVVDGDLMKDDVLYRKLALYTQDDDRKVTAKFTLTVPKLIIKSPNTRIQSGIVKGDVYVENTGFNLVDTTVEGNIYFDNKEAIDTFTIDDRSKVTGKMVVADVDVVTSASLVVDGDALVSALSADGTWIVAVYHNMNLKQEIVVDGEFMPKEAIDRKLALYTQDDDRKITASFTVAAPKMTVKSENFRIQGGTFKGDVYVEANGFQLSKNASVDGNIFFATQENKDSFILEDGSTVTGTMEVQ